jgi:hypothetical protein
VRLSKIIPPVGVIDNYTSLPPIYQDLPKAIQEWILQKPFRNGYRISISISISIKHKKIKKPMSIAAKTNKLYKHIKKPMSIAAKTKPNQKTNEHSIQKSQKVLKPMSIAAHLNMFVLQFMRDSLI